jgi:hypothetical protein
MVPDSRLPELADFIDMALSLSNSACSGTLSIHERRFFGYLTVDYETNDCYACALGLALIGKYRAVRVAIARWERLHHSLGGSSEIAAARILNIPLSLVRYIDISHLSGKSAHDIAATLRVIRIGEPAHNLGDICTEAP